MAFFIKNCLKTQFFACFLVKHVENKQKSRFWAIFWPPPQKPPQKGGVFLAGQKKRTEIWLEKVRFFTFPGGPPWFFQKNPKNRGSPPPDHRHFLGILANLPKNAKKCNFLKKKGLYRPCYKAKERAVWAPKTRVFRAPFCL